MTERKDGWKERYFALEIMEARRKCTVFFKYGKKRTINSESYTQ